MQNFRRAGLVAVRAVQNALDEALFEFADRFVKQYPGAPPSD